MPSLSVPGIAQLRQRVRVRVGEGQVVVRRGRQLLQRLAHALARDPEAQLGHQGLQGGSSLLGGLLRGLETESSRGFVELQEVYVV